MDNNYMLVWVTSVLNFMFFVSGFDKLFHFGKVVNGLNARLGNRLPMMVYQMLIVCAIVIEIVCPAIVFYGSLMRSKRNDRLATYASVMLIVFTVVATLFYHFPPTTSAKYYPFMSNMSLVGGQSLMAMVFYNRDVLL